MTRICIILLLCIVMVMGINTSKPENNFYYSLSIFCYGTAFGLIFGMLISILTESYLTKYQTIKQYIPSFEIYRTNYGIHINSNLVFCNADGTNSNKKDNSELIFGIYKNGDTFDYTINREYATTNCIISTNIVKNNVKEKND